MLCLYAGADEPENTADQLLHLVHMMHASLKMQVTKCCVCVHVQVDGTLTEQEVMTVARYFSNQGQQPGMDAQKLVAIAQEQLRKRNYESFNNLLESLQHQDRTK